ncbi:MAG: hypothetical protein IKS78_03015, partial [Clostridia bacterium]|nr:hypothetical protein [Clostridia bacterium]
MAVLWAIPALLCLLLALLLAAVIRTLLIPSKKSTYTPQPDPDRAAALAKKLSRMVQYDTVSVPNTDQREKFLGFHKILEAL